SILGPETISTAVPRLKSDHTGNKREKSTSGGRHDSRRQHQNGIEATCSASLP
ncbi:unnamed protein product, partial [Ectocarpus sp. 13 AM-2016]